MPGSIHVATMLGDVWVELILLIAFIVLGMAINIGRWIFRRTNAPIMNETINRGSERFFDDEAAREQRMSSGYIPLDDPDPPMYRDIVRAIRRPRPKS
jgi:hypothetical protein